jgi:GNAT superfamily N-acetyltransferase
MELRPVAYGEALVLTRALWQEMVDRYGDGDESPAHPEQFLPPYGVFLVGSLGGNDVACGGLRLRSKGIGEIKRMYVEPSARGRGLSREVLLALLAHARSVGLAEVWLETGTEQPEARRLYESAGFLPMEAYGDYKDDARSRCYRLVLRPVATDA